MHCEPIATGGWRITGVVARPDGARVLREHMDFAGVSSDLAAAQLAGVSIADRLLRAGAAELLALPEIFRSAGNSNA